MGTVLLFVAVFAAGVFLSNHVKRVFSIGFYFALKLFKK